MKRLRWFSAALAAFLALSGVGHAQVGAPVAGASGPPSGSYTTAQQQAAAASLATPWIVAKAALPFVSVSTGTMANNGALTVGTALPTTYASAYFFLPAGAVAAGVPAAGTWYYTTCSSTTACTVFNNVYASGIPAIPASPTAFATTGPGAYTGDTTEEFGPTFTIPALTANAGYRCTFIVEVNNTVGAKTYRHRFSGSGGTVVYSANAASVTHGEGVSYTLNRGATNKQVNFGLASTVVDGAGVPYTSVDTSTATTSVHSLQKATATDNQILEALSCEVISDGT